MLLEGCSTLVGNVRPVEDKTDQYHFQDLSRTDPDWKRLNPSGGEEPDTPETVSTTQRSDLVFQHQGSDAVISVNSACRSLDRPDARTLQELTKTLFLGFAHVESRSEQEQVVSGQPALETTILGTLSGERTQMRSTVLRYQNCVFDLLYIARPESFTRHLSVFDGFVKEFRLASP